MTKLDDQDDAERLRRIPAWAMHEILRLRGDNQSLRAKLSAGPENSNAFLNPYSSSPTPLGQNPVIEFGTPDERNGMRDFVVRYRDGELVVNGTAAGLDEHMVVMPQSGNQVLIRHLKKP